MRENTVIYQLTSIQASQSRSGSRRWGAVAGTRAAPARVVCASSFSLQRARCTALGLMNPPKMTAAGDR